MSQMLIGCTKAEIIFIENAIRDELKMCKCQPEFIRKFGKASFDISGCPATLVVWLYPQCFKNEPAVRDRIRILFGFPKTIRLDVPFVFRASRLRRPKLKQVYEHTRLQNEYLDRMDYILSICDHKPKLTERDPVL